MTANEATTLISTVGFPIVACGFMGWFSYTMVMRVNQTMTEVQIAMSKLSDSIDDLCKEVINK